jgi:hypothetical protein
MRAVILFLVHNDPRDLGPSRPGIRERKTFPLSARGRSFITATGYASSTPVEITEKHPIANLPIYPDPDKRLCQTQGVTGQVKTKAVVLSHEQPGKSFPAFLTQRSKQKKTKSGF